MKFKFCIFGLIFLANEMVATEQPAYHHTNPAPLLNRAIDFIFKEDFARAMSLLDTLIQDKPTDPTGYFFRGVSYWRESTLLAEWTQHDQLQQKWLEQCLQVTRVALKKDPHDANALLYQGGAHGFLGTMYARQKNWFKTGLHAWKGMRALEQVLELAPQNFDSYYGLGLYHVMAGHQTGVVRWLQRLLPIPTGDAARGIDALKVAAEKGKYTSTAARAALALTYLYFEHDYQQAIDILEPLSAEYSESIDFLSMLVNARFNREFTHPHGEWQALILCLDRLEEKYRLRKLTPNPWWRKKMQFMRGYAAYHLDQLDVAQDLLERYAHNYVKNGGSYLTGLSELTLGKIFDRRGQRHQAQQKYVLALQQEKLGNVAQLASYYLRHPFTRETPTWRVRGAHSELPNRP